MYRKNNQSRECFLSSFYISDILGQNTGLFSVKSILRNGKHWIYIACIPPEKKIEDIKN